ncbi:MAG TPA: GNAT family N-acetyltransferase [Acidimicrobiales bacterium]|nr:GNAT family N-acetyltransferase [Acidimicrobiales bacterium]
MDEPELAFRSLTRADFPRLVEWLARPHVARWWESPSDRAGVEEEYGPSIEGTDPTLLFMVAHGAVDVAFVQIYRMADNPEYARAVGRADAAGIDLLIGDEAQCGHGLGPRLIGAAAGLIWAHYPEVAGALAGPSVHNVRSQRAFEKAGFVALGPVSIPGEKDDEMILHLPRPTAA